MPYHQPYLLQGIAERAVPASGSIDPPACHQDHASAEVQLGDDGLLELWIQVSELLTEAAADPLDAAAEPFAAESLPAVVTDPVVEQRQRDSCSWQCHGSGGSLCMPPDGSDSDGQQYHQQQGSLPQDSGRCVMDDGVTSCSGCRAWRCIVTGRIALAGWTALVVAAHSRVRRLSLGTPY